MNRLETISVDQQKEAFLTTLSSVQEQLVHKGIDYRIVGSIASHAYVDGTSHTVPPLSYDRPGAATPDQRVPDIDLIVPRADLKGARELRAQFLHDPIQPVKLGLASSTTELDFRPDQEVSYLTHKHISLPVDTNLFEIENGHLAGEPIRTVPVNTLAHTYGTFGGLIRQKDMPILKELIRQSGTHRDPRTDVFHEFQKKRRAVSPNDYLLGLSVEAFNDVAPIRLRNELYRVALKAASLLGKR